MIGEVLRGALVLWLAALLTGVSGVAVYVVLFYRIEPTTPWTGRVLCYLGSGLIVLAALVMAGGGFGLGVQGMSLALRRP